MADDRGCRTERASGLLGEVHVPRWPVSKTATEGALRHLVLTVEVAPQGFAHHGV
jgi:hypothetical protein